MESIVTSAELVRTDNVKARKQKLLEPKAGAWATEARMERGTTMRSKQAKLLRTLAAGKPQPCNLSERCEGGEIRCPLLLRSVSTLLVGPRQLLSEFFNGAW